MKLILLTALCATLFSSTDLAAQPAFSGVTNVANTAAGDTLQINWNAAQGTGPIVYSVYVSTDSGQFKFGGPHAQTVSLQAFVHGLVPGQTYYVIVRATDKDGVEEENFKTLSAVPGTSVYEAGAGCTVSNQKSAEPFGTKSAAGVLLLLAGISAVRFSRRGSSS